VSWVTLSRGESISVLVGCRQLLLTHESRKVWRMQRVASTIQLRQENEYEQCTLHQQTWPEVLSVLKATSIGNAQLDTRVELQMAEVART
jgi:hypothetical protein